MSALVRFSNDKQGAIADVIWLKEPLKEEWIAHNATPSCSACASIEETCASIRVRVQEFD